MPCRGTHDYQAADYPHWEEARKAFWLVYYVRPLGALVVVSFLSPWLVSIALGRVLHTWWATALAVVSVACLLWMVHRGLTGLYHNHVARKNNFHQRRLLQQEGRQVCFCGGAPWPEAVAKKRN